MREAYRRIKEVYKDNRAKRSNVPLINHIDEGLVILEKIKANQIVKDAYCIHPILQEDKNFINNLYDDFTGINPSSLLLAMEYRRVANSYLSTKKLTDFVGLTCEEIKQMLIADKVQNYKDFLKYHSETHPRAKELDQYFNNWFKILQIDYSEFFREAA